MVKTIKEQGIILERLSFQFANWNRGQAENKMTQLINQYGDEIELVLSNNDEMALGAVAAYDALDYDKDRRPMIFGIDGFIFIFQKHLLSFKRICLFIIVYQPIFHFQSFLSENEPFYCSINDSTFSAVTF